MALDLGGIEAAGQWIARADSRHPSLIDAAHRLDQLFGIVNVPSGVWIDERGTIVRPPETAYPRRSEVFERPIRPSDPPDVAARIREVHKIRIEPEKYMYGLRDWAVNGARSRYALAPDEVIARSAPRGVEAATAAAYFELGQHLFRGGATDAAVIQFRAAHRLQPANWTYKRQAWSLADPGQRPTSLYDGDWLSDVQRVGAENYYPPLQMD